MYIYFLFVESMRFRYAIFFITLLLPLVLLITCVKEYSYEGGPLAEFTIKGAPTTCNPVSISGAFIKGNLLDSTDFATVTADVSFAGKYYITTNSADGVSFSGFGTFSDTGTHVVFLKASGTPVDTGKFNISIPGINGCSFNLFVKDKAPGSYVLSGSPIDCSKPIIKGNFIQYQQLTDENKVVLNVDVAKPGTYNIQTDTSAGIYFSAFGYFSSTGNQAVTLIASGNPDKAGLSYFNVHADSSQCSFSVPVVPQPTLGVYVLEYGEDTVCQQYDLKGNYEAGISLNSRNTLSFKVYVTDLGNYSIYTRKNDGVIFGTSGTFSQLGEQTVVLNG
ncbi:MAG: hypothetical protein ACTHJN_01240, partial [Ginsengibacter sp.]